MQSLKFKQLLLIAVTLQQLLELRMESEISRKRNAFRQSLRREFIQSYQRQVRMKYMIMEREERIQKHRMANYQNMDNVLLVLTQIQKSNSQQICTNDNFDFFIQALNFVVSSKKQVPAISQNQFSNNRNQQYGAFQTSNIEYQVPVSKSYHMESNANRIQSKRLSQTWSCKQNIYSLLSKILRKAIQEPTCKIKYVISKVVYLLQFPQLLPLWEQLACISDEKTKNYCAQQFAKKLRTSFTSLSQNDFKKFNNFQIILDPEFVLDILMKFAEPPYIQFANTLQLLPFVTYALNIYNERECENKQQSYRKINKTCTILRNILKDNGHEKFNKLIQQGFQNIFIYLMEYTQKIFLCKHMRIHLKDQQSLSKMQQQHSHLKNQIYQPKIECGYLKNNGLNYGRLKRPMSISILAMINLIKLINRLFVVNKDVAMYLYHKNAKSNLFASLFSCFINGQFYCSEFEMVESQKQINKGEELKLCDSHSILPKLILSTIHVILMVGNSFGYEICHDFLASQGIQFLIACLCYEQYSLEFSRQIVNILMSLDSTNNTFYGRLNSDGFKKFIQIQSNLLCLWTNAYENEKSKLKTHKFDVQMQVINQLQQCLQKLLKILRNSILTSYATATQPQIFQQASFNFMQLQQYRQILDYLRTIQCSSKKQYEIKVYSTNIYQLCKDPKQYFQKCNSVPKNLILQQNRE